MWTQQAAVQWLAGSNYYLEEAKMFAKKFENTFLDHTGIASEYAVRKGFSPVFAVNQLQNYMDCFESAPVKNVGYRRTVVRRDCTEDREYTKILINTVRERSPPPKRARVKTLWPFNGFS